MKIYTHCFLLVFVLLPVLLKAQVPNNEHFNIKEYLAVNDEKSADDAINDAISLNKRVIYLSTGNYTLSNSITPINTVKIYGDGRDKATLTIDGCIKGIDLSSLSAKNGITLEGFTLKNINCNSTWSPESYDGESNTSTPNSVGLDLFNFTNGSRISDLSINNFDVGINLQRSWYSSFEDIYMKNNTVGLRSLQTNENSYHQVNNVSFYNFNVYGGVHAVFIRMNYGVPGSPGVGINFRGGIIENTSRTAIYFANIKNFGLFDMSFINNNTSNWSVTAPYLFNSSINSNSQQQVIITDVYNFYADRGNIEAQQMHPMILIDNTFLSEAISSGNPFHIAAGEGVAIVGSGNVFQSDITNYGVTEIIDIHDLPCASKSPTTCTHTTLFFKE
ncbi:glycosyl hydrolase family 28-related protein [Flocculibacter collagenilyticus]|uniref:glycosyl hydrolase family 28-related protein n=1 Tax=Flocculibacter collagenilyticus TaxID=2744479 RepID=UPI0018F7834A|nr:glycosyl hydrolase family 28-related protein [Flocculibacter collagenilyticus]